MGRQHLNFSTANKLSSYCTRDTINKESLCPSNLALLLYLYRTDVFCQKKLPWQLKFYPLFDDMDLLGGTIVNQCTLSLQA